MIKGVYAGTFDPITTGHLDIIERSLACCNELEIAIGVNSAKQTMFSEAERMVQINLALDKRLDFLTGTRIKVTKFSGLLVNYAQEVGATVLIRGIRSVSDFEYEINLANINKTLAPHIETIFLPTSPELAVVSSSMIKEIAKHGGNVNQFTIPEVAEQVKNKFGFIKYGV